MRQWFFSLQGHDSLGVFVSANVWFDARELAMQILDTNELEFVSCNMPIEPADKDDFRVVWFGSDMGSNVKRKVNQVYDGKKWSVI